MIVALTAYSVPAVHRKSGCKPTPAIDRLMARIEYDTVGGCWLWPGAVQRGYGVIGEGRNLTATHRVTYREFRGDPTGKVVCHKCDVPACCNPDHLFLGTQADNLADMRAKGRWRPPVLKGEGHPHSILTETQVAEIRRQFAAGVTQTALAARFGTAQANVSSIVLRKAWRHVA